MNLEVMASRPAITFMTGDELATTLAAVIAGVAGGTTGKWRKIIGRVERLHTWQHVTHNWRVEPSGTWAERQMVEQAVKIVRAEHPYIA